MRGSMDRQTLIEIMHEWGYKFLFFFGYIAPMVAGFVVAYWTFFGLVPLIPIHLLLIAPFIKFVFLNEIVLYFFENPIINYQRRICWFDEIVNYMTALGITVVIESCCFGLMYFLFWLF